MPRPPIDQGTVLITGASSGIGREMARLLAPRARTLVIVARRRERLEELRAELIAKHTTLKVVVAPADCEDLASLEAMLQQVAREAGDVDVLINNAGLGDVGLFELTEWKKQAAMMRVNCEALTWLTHRLVPGMVARGKGGILNISSGFGLSWQPGAAVYAATKHYVTAFTEALRLEMRGTGVVVTQSCPGPVSTEFEAVSGNPTGMSVPKAVEIGPEQCARETLAAFDAGRALTVPGFVIWFLIGFGRVIPRWFQRLMYAPIGPFLRKKQKGAPLP